MIRTPQLLRSIRQASRIVAACALLGWFVSAADAQALFFQGKTVIIIQGRDPGGSGDLRTKALVLFLQKYIPRNPTVIMEFIPGAGGRMAANYLFRTAKTDWRTYCPTSGDRELCQIGLSLKGGCHGASL